MKKYVIATLLSASLMSAAASADTLQPTMSAQDVRSQIEPNPTHLLVPIMFMMMILIAGAGTSTPAAPVLQLQPG